MYALDVICSNGHTFESWFKDRRSFEEQQANSLVSCPYCGDSAVEQVLTPVRIGKHKNADTRAPSAENNSNPVTGSATANESANAAANTQNAGAAKLMELIEKSFEDVGNKFADEALKMHFGESDKRNIRGIATPDEQKELADEGVQIIKIPEFQ